jgi:N-methylhydantoinase A
MVMSEPTLDGSKALFLTGEDISHHNLQPAFLSLEKGLKEQMKSLCKTGTMHVERFLDLRYQGQSYEISIKYDDDFEKVFHKTHTHHFGYKLSDVPLELVSIRCTIRMETPSFELPAEKGKKTKLPIQEEMAPVLFENGKVVVPVYQRKLLKPGHTLKGPALVVDNYTTILVQENYELSVDSLLNIILIPFK